MGEHRAHAPERAHEARAQREIPFGIRDCFERQRLRKRHRRVRCAESLRGVDEDVDGTESRHSPRNQCVHLLGLSHVAADAKRPRPNRLHFVLHGFDGRCGARGQDDGGAFGTECEGYSAADSASAPGDDRDLAFEPSHSRACADRRGDRA
jgi:hypothetical protein